MSESQTGGGKYPGIGDKADLDNHANQCNPNNPNYEGRPKGYPGDGSKADLDNRSNQLNPNNERYQEKKWTGLKSRDWQVTELETIAYIYIIVDHVKKWSAYHHTEVAI